MKRIFLAMTAVGALAAAAPAAAQYANANAGGAVGIDNRIGQIETRLQAGIRAGTISRTEATMLRRELRDLRRVQRLYSANGLTQQERADLQARIRDLRADIRIADGRNAGWDDDDRYAEGIDRNRDGWDDRDYDRDGRWDDDVDEDGRFVARIDRNRDGWDDRDYDRDGRWDDNVSGQGGPYEEVDDCVDRGGIGGVIEDVLGAGCTTLRVGARASGNLSAVPYEHRSRFRDGGGYYYRYRSGNVYQIDSRTQVVTRIYDVD